MNTRTNTKEPGTAIILVISILATLMVIVAVALEYTMNIGRNVRRSNTLGSAIAVADGCIEYNFAQWRKYCRTPGQSKPTTNDLNSLPLPTAAQFPDIPNFAATRNDYDPTSNITVQQCRVEAVDPELNALASSSPPPQDVGDGSTTYNYRSYAYVTLPTRGGNLVAKVQRIFQQERLSPLNYAIFYVDPLEIHPGAPFTVTGWVHTNSNLYTAHDLLNFAQKATYSGDWSIGFRPGDTVHNGETPTSPTGVTPVYDSPRPPSNIDPTGFNPSDPNNTGYHELIEPPVPSSSPDPFSDTRYYNQASVILQIDASNNVTIKKPNGDGTTTTLTSSSKGNNLLLYNMFHASGVITTNQPIQDNREQASVRITTLDVSKLTVANSTAVNKVAWAAGTVFNGTVYIDDISASTSARRGIRVKNGKFIPDGGFTVASPNPVYVQGDFNTGLNPPSNTGDPTKPQGTLSDGSRYTREPCSVIADAVNILSNAWLDSNSGTQPAASPTTVNSAIVTGIVTSGSGFVYTGGAENFPRFLENWSAKDFTYYGSMIELYDSQQSTGVWGKKNVYTPPNRKWYFDTNFKLNRPPGAAFLETYSYTKGRWSLVP